MSAPCFSGRGQARPNTCAAPRSCNKTRGVRRTHASSVELHRHTARAWTIAAAAIEEASSARAALGGYDALLASSMVSDGDDEEPTQTQRMNRALKRPTSLAELQDLVEDQAHAFDAINLSHAFSRLAKLHRAAQPPGEKQGTAAGAHAAVVSRVLNSLVAQLPRLGSEFDCRDTATCLWALAALPRASSREHGHTFEMLCRRGRQLAVLMTPADAAMYMLAFGNLGTADPTLLHAIPQVLLHELDRTEPRDVRAVLWGFARLRAAPSKMFMEAVCDNLVWTIDQYSCQELTNCLWAIAKLGHHPRRALLRSAEQKLLETQALLCPKDVAHALWAFGRLHYRASHLLTELPVLLARRLHAYSPEELSCVLYGYTHARHYSPALLDAAAPLLVAHAGAGRMSEQDVVIALWAYGIFRHRPTEPARRDGAAPSPSPAFVDGLLDGLLDSNGALHASHMRPVALTNLVKALAGLRMHSARSAHTAAFTAAVASETEKRVEEFSPDEMSNVLYGLSVMRAIDLGPYYAVVRELLKRMEVAGAGGSMDGSGEDAWLTHRHVNSIVHSCVSAGYTPWTLIESAEMHGIRVKSSNPSALEPRWEQDAQPPPSPGPRPQRARPASMHGTLHDAHVPQGMHDAMHGDVHYHDGDEEEEEGCQHAHEDAHMRTLPLEHEVCAASRHAAPELPSPSGWLHPVHAGAGVRGGRMGGALGVTVVGHAAAVAVQGREHATPHAEQEVVRHLHAPRPVHRHYDRAGEGGAAEVPVQGSHIA